jgi:hypothetical protein
MFQKLRRKQQIIGCGNDLLDKISKNIKERQNI